MARVVNQAELAEIFGVSTQTINAWQAEGLPVAVKGRRGSPNSYDTAKAIKWYAARETGKIDETQKDRLSRVQADRIEMEMATKRGALIPADEIGEAWRELVLAFRQQMLALPMALSPLLEMRLAGEILAELTEAIHAALGKLALDESGVDGAAGGNAQGGGAAPENPSVVLGGTARQPTARNGHARPLPV